MQRNNMASFLDLPDDILVLFYTKYLDAISCLKLRYVNKRLLDLFSMDMILEVVTHDCVIESRLRGTFIREGPYRSSYPINQIKYKGDYHLGIQIGTWEGYDLDGRLDSRIIYKDDGKGKDYTTFEYEYDRGDGYINRQQSYENNLLHGVAYDYYPDGTVANEIPYYKGSIHGIFRNYFTDGSLRQETEFKRGLRDGPCLVYYFSGALRLRAFYENDRFTKYKKFYNEESAEDNNYLPFISINGRHVTEILNYYDMTDDPEDIEDCDEEIRDDYEKYYRD